MGLREFLRDLALFPDVWRWNCDRARIARRARATHGGEAPSTPSSDLFYERYVLEPQRNRARFRRGIEKIVRETIAEVSPSTKSSTPARMSAARPAATDAASGNPERPGDEP